MSLALRGALATLLLLYVGRSSAHDDAGDHGHAESCRFSVNDDTYSLAGLKRTTDMYSYTDNFEGFDMNYFFNLCNDAANVQSTQCLGPNNTKMPVYACQIAYGRDGVISLGDDFMMEAYDGHQSAIYGTAGVHVNISGGDACHNGDERQLDLWIECDPDAGVGTPRPAGEHLETGHCEYDILWRSAYGCRECREEDYTKEWVDSLTTCEENGNVTVRYKKKEGVICAHGVHGGVMTTQDLNEYCDGDHCPNGFKRYEVLPHSELFSCQACPMGFSTATPMDMSCTACTGNTFADKPGSDKCYPCGKGTKANAQHTACEFEDGVCTLVQDSVRWDLSPMGSTERMAGPIWDRSNHQYYLNLCTTSHELHSCFDSSSEPLISYSCQIPQGGQPAKDLGDTIGLVPLNSTQQDKYPNGGVMVQLSRGSVCHHTGAAPARSTDILVVCDLSAGVGQPERPDSTSWNPLGEVEPHSGCQYEFKWASRYGCPVCSAATYVKRPDVCDTSTGYVIPTYDIKKRSDGQAQPCIGNFDGSETGTVDGPAVWEDRNNMRPCTATEVMCPAGFKQVLSGSLTMCQPCPPGQSSAGDTVTQCTRCTGNTYAYESGSPECIQCGEGTTANEEHNGCTKLAECQFELDDEVFDLKPLDKGTSAAARMFGPIVDVNVVSSNPDEQFQYFINLCSRQTADALSCAGDDGVAIKSFACQRTTLTSATLGHLVGKSLGDTMGVRKAPDGNLTVTLSHGTRCHHHGQPFRETTIDLVCDPTAVHSSPEPWMGTAENGYCKYHFVWRTVHACPVCTAAHFTKVVSECAKSQGSDDFSQTTHYKPLTGCNSQAPDAAVLQDKTSSCTPPSAGGGDQPWYKSPGFLITVIVLSSTVFAVVVVLGLVKYYKVRRLYEAYAQLDKDRGVGDDFSMPESLELEGRKHDGL